MSRRKVSPSEFIWSSYLTMLNPPVDENLYYRSTNKDDASDARREQSHGVGLKTIAAPDDAAAGEGSGAKPASKKPKMKQPPYLFRNAQGLLMMTQQHNVRFAHSLSACVG